MWWHPEWEFKQDKPKSGEVLSKEGKIPSEDKVQSGGRNDTDLADVLKFQTLQRHKGTTEWHMCLFKDKEGGPSHDEPTWQGPAGVWKWNVRAYRAHIICII